MEDLNERDWGRLVETIRRGNCVLILGSDVAVDPADAKLTPLSVRLARQLAGALSPGTPVGDGCDLALVAQLCLEQSDYDRYDLELDVKKFYEPFIEQTTDFHRDLAALPFTLSLITTPDRFLFNALSEPKLGRSPTKVFYNFYKPGQRVQVPAGNTRQPTVYGLFGDLDVPESLVLAETELLDFLVKIVTPSSGLPPAIAGRLADLQTSFLFIGFGFQRWYTRILLHVLKTQRHRSRSLALEGTAFFDHPDRSQTAVFFEQEHSIVFRQHSWRDFAAELRQRYQAVEKKAKATPTPEPPSGAPKIFLCHDSRDRDGVEDVEQRLHALGVDTWRDRQDLRGGEDWGRRIRQVIAKQVDYVLVLETPHMVSRDESYLYEEIDAALERQKRFRPGRPFLIPAILERCDPLEELNHLNLADLTTQPGIERLAKEILEDWAGRQAQRSEGVE